MTTRTPYRFGSIAGAALLAGAALFAPAAAFAAPQTGTPATAENDPAENAPAEGDTGICTISDATLTWGVKESFRSYISGSIANGEWQTADGATYETPSFQWHDGTGTFDPETGVGSLSFAGSVTFTGHDGVLKTTLANPTIEFDEDGQTALLLDAQSNNAEGELVIESEQEWVGDVVANAPLVGEGGVIALSDLPTTLTNSGAKAFAGFYEAGAELDPITLAGTANGCDPSAAGELVVPDEPPAELYPGDETEETAAANVPWVPIVIGGVAILVIGVTGGMLLSGRKKK